MARLILLIAGTVFILTNCSRAPEAMTTIATTTTPDLLQPERPAITSAEVGSDIVGRVVNVTGLQESGPPTPWTFEADDYRQVQVLNERESGDQSIVDVVVTTDNSPLPGENDVHVAGTLRLHYDWSAGKWNLGEIENVSFRYSFTHG